MVVKMLKRRLKVNKNKKEEKVYSLLDEIHPFTF